MTLKKSIKDVNLTEIRTIIFYQNDLSEIFTKLHNFSNSDFHFEEIPKLENNMIKIVENSNEEEEEEENGYFEYSRFETKTIQVSSKYCLISFSNGKSVQTYEIQDPQSKTFELLWETKLSNIKSICFIENEKLPYLCCNDQQYLYFLNLQNGNILFKVQLSFGLINNIQWNNSNPNLLFLQTEKKIIFTIEISLIVKKRPLISSSKISFFRDNLRLNSKTNLPHIQYQKKPIKL